MRTRLSILLPLLLTLALLTFGLAAAQGPRSQATIGTTFAYQGRLNAGGSPAEGIYDFKFTLYDDASGGTQVGSTVVKDDVGVSRGLFAVELDFGDVFRGQAVWLEVAVKGPGDAAFTTLAPRQALLPTPYALYATRAADAATAGELTTEVGGIRLQPGGAYTGGPNVIGGFAMNSATSGAYGATISGGGGQLKLPPDVGYWINTASNYAAVGGGSDNHATGENSTVSGGIHNTASEFWTTVGGGFGNSATNSGATVAGGGNNAAGGGDAFVGGGSGNTASQWWATVAGGEENLAAANYATVGGGQSNTASGEAATVPGGAGNTAQGAYSFAAGHNARALHDGAFVWADSGGDTFSSSAADQFMVRAGGGITVTATGGALRLEPTHDNDGYLRTYGADIANVIAGCKQNFAGEGVVGATISGGGAPWPFFYFHPFDAKPNFITEDFGAIGGGLSNRAEGYAATVGGGENNAATGDYSTVGGGGGAIDTRGVLKRGNVASASGSTVGGGIGNETGGASGTISGGTANSVSAAFGTIGGGGGEWDASGASTTGNRATDEYGTVGGGHNNQAGDGAGTTQDRPYATVGGGNSNTASGETATIGGGKENVASARFTTVGGGIGNTASFQFATIGGGWSNTASGDGSTVAGGVGNNVSGLNATIAGGNDNRAGGQIASVGGGRNNKASSYAATVGGGVSNEATGERSTISGGASNKATGYASTVAGGMNNTASAIRSTISGGESNTASGTYATIPGGHMNVAQGSYSLAVGRRAKALSTGCFVWGDSTDADITCNATNAWVARATGGVYFYTNSALTSGVRVLAGASAWSSVSDRKLKENFAIANGQDVLERLSKVPITTWNYKAQDASIRHMGPVAQDFYAAFGLGEDERLISTIDADGVALAAIQGLYEISTGQASRIQQLEAENAELKHQMEDLQTRLANLEALVAQMAQRGAGGGQ
ncbi:MAG: hypothetical protein Kow00123_00780 [Anaerolineales bacterium]